MDEYFLRDDDIVCDNSREYKAFDLACEDWKVSPTANFSLESSDLSFTTENLLDGVTKQDNSFGDFTSEGWFSVLNTKESWSETKSKSSQERYLTEQVVPDQGQGLDSIDQKKKSVPIQEIQTNFVQSSKKSSEENSQSPTETSTNLIMNSQLEDTIVQENSNKSLFICNHKEQVKNEQENFKRPPANALFTFLPLCEEKTTENLLEDGKSTESIKGITEESLSSPFQATLVNEEDLLKTTNDRHTTSNDHHQPATKVKTSRNLTTGHKCETTQLGCKENSGKHEDLNFHDKLIKLLTATELPKCTMVNYKFDSSSKLPSFVEAFFSGRSEDQRSKEREIELPNVLQKEENTGRKEEEMFLLLSESDSETECSDIDVDDELHEEAKPNSLGLVSQNSKTKIKAEAMEIESQIINTKTKNTPNADTPSSLLAIDDELEKFLVSSIVLNDRPHSNSSLLPDLSDNIGSILTSEELNDENCIDAAYGNLFLKRETEVDVNGTRTCKQEQTANECLKMAETLDNYQGNIFNGALLGTERAWQEQIAAENMNAFYGNVWTRAVPNAAFVNQINSRHFANNTFHINDPFINTPDFKTMQSSLQADIMQTENDPFKFSSTVPKVEVVDSSLNYGF